MNSYTTATAKFAEIIKRIGNDTLDPDRVNKALQDIVEGKFNLFSPAATPRVKSGNWAMSRSSQVNRLLQLSKINEWGIAESDIPRTPKYFNQTTATEKLLLAVYFDGEYGLSSELTTFKKWSSALSAPDGYTMWVWPDIQVDEKHMQLVGLTSRPGIRWVAYDPCAHWGPESSRRVSELWDYPPSRTTLAVSESIMALSYDPSWALRWNGTKTVPYPNLAGWQYNKVGGVWRSVLYLHRTDDNGFWVNLFVSDGISEIHQNWSSPTVRELH